MKKAHKSVDKHPEIAWHSPKEPSRTMLYFKAGGHVVRIDLVVTSFFWTHEAGTDGFRAIILGKFEPGDVALECDLEEAVKASASEAAR